MNEKNRKQGKRPPRLSTILESKEDKHPKMSNGSEARQESIILKITWIRRTYKRLHRGEKEIIE